MNRIRTLTLASLIVASDAASDLWTVEIDRSPAPPPELGPPFSANASRDPRLLPYQITGIAGSYVCTVLVIGILLLTVGRRSRKRAQALAMNGKSREMVRPLGATFDPSPISPQSQRSWYTPRRFKGKQSAAGSIKSAGSVVSPGFESVASFDANVIEADRQRRAEEMERLYAAVMARDERENAAPPEYTCKLRVPDAVPQDYQDGLQSPRSPVRAIYPPEAHTYDQDDSGYRQRSTSFGSGQAAHSSPRKFRRSIKNIKISAPIIRPDDNSDGARTPLSPRVYMNPGIPPEPPTARTVDTFDSAQYAPTTPGTARSLSWNQMDEIQEVPQPYPQRAKNYSQPLSLDIAKSTNASAASINNTLPFRQLHWNDPASPYYPYQGQGPFSAGPIKTTFVESRREHLAIGTPKTGMATPYSAYMPFTPITPVTTHISSRAERRQRERDERALQGAITEEDQVVDDKELWDEGY